MRSPCASTRGASPPTGRLGPGTAGPPQRKQVEASGQAVQRYREQTDAVSLEDEQNIVVQKLSLSNTFIQQQKGELADLRSSRRCATTTSSRKRRNRA